MYTIIARESKYIKYIYFFSSSSLQGLQIASRRRNSIYMDLYICCTFTSTCTAADDLSLDELLTRVGEK